MKSSEFIQIYRRKQIGSIAVFGGLFLIFAAILVLLYFKVQASVVSVQNKNTEYKSLLDGLNSIADLSHDEVAANNALPNLEKILPATLDVSSSIVPEVKRIASKDNVSIELQLGNENPGSVSQASSINFSLIGTGPIEGLNGFLRDLESSQNIINIVTFNVTNTGINRYQLNISGLLYTRPSF